MFAQVIGGAAAVAVGVYMTNSIGQESIESVAAGGISVQDSVLVVNRSRFTNCMVARAYGQGNKTKKKAGHS